MDLSGAEVPKPKNKGGAPKGHAVSEKTREALKKGFEVLKAKREAKKKEKEEALKKAAEVISEVKISNEPVATVAPLITPPPSKPPRQRMKTVSKTDFLSFKDDILSILDKKMSAPIPVPSVVPSVVPAVQVPSVPAVLSGNDLLNKIFFKR
jgi:hypothetical protein